MFRQKLLALMYRLLPIWPSGKRLHLMSWTYRHCGWEPEIGFLPEIGPCRGTALDIGANAGFYSLALTRLYSQVIAFEPNREVSEPLRQASLKNVHIINAGVSSRSGSSTLFLPFSRGQSLPGWASLDRENCPEADGLISFAIELCTIDELGFTDVGFIKIDVEGHELEALRGGSVTIRRDLPHLLVEVKDSNLDALRATLSDWGYREVTLESLGGPSGSPENHIFVPL